MPHLNGISFDYFVAYVEKSETQQRFYLGFTEKVFLGKKEAVES